MRLQGKRIIVTGGAQGMGASTVRAYLDEGACVVSMDRKVDQGQAMIDSVAAGHRARAEFVPIDVADKSSVDRAFDEAVDFLGGLDVLIHVAGVQRSRPTLDFSADDITYLIGTNLNGTIYTNQAAVRLMLPHHSGVIINFGSDSGLVPIKNISVYSATKGGVMAWTRSIAGEFAAFGIRANSVVPAIKTPMTDAGRAERGDFYASVPLGGDLGDAETDLNPVMVFLAGDDSRFITGQLISVNGGKVMVR